VTEAERPASAGGVEGRALAAYAWVQDHLPKSPHGKIALALVVGALVLIPSIGLLLLPLWGVDLGEDEFASLSYGGVFLANLASTATVFIPVPGLTAVGQALIIQQGDVQNYPLLVGIVGGLGMAIGEITAYAAGAVGSEVARDTEIKAPERIRPAVEKTIASIDWLMDNYGFWTLLVLSAIPNPFFELAGLTAGAVRMNFWRFMVAVTIGKCTRGVMLAYAGAWGLDIPWIT
jgi:membrane protein DedA with SNARE-associated domain